VQAALTALIRPGSHRHQRIDLRDLHLAGAQFNAADLTGADLTGADLTRADLTGADLTGADLTGALLLEVNLNEGLDDRDGPERRPAP
jgi:uncharacterized protein YjbI with pentapeptide repeats